MSAPLELQEVAEMPVTEMSDRALLMEVVETLRALRQIVEAIGNTDTPMTRMLTNMLGIGK